MITMRLSIKSCTFALFVCVLFNWRFHTLHNTNIHSLHTIQLSVEAVELMFSCTFVTTQSELDITIGQAYTIGYYNVRLVPTLCKTLISSGNKQWRFYVGARGHRPPKSCPGFPNF